MKLTADLRIELRHGNRLLVPCQGKQTDGSAHCHGLIQIPFAPGINGVVAGTPLYAHTAHEVIWDRVGGTSLDDLTLTPSIDAGDCGHFHVTSGEIVP